MLGVITECRLLPAAATGQGSDENEPTDSPVGWVAKHVKQYVQSNGTLGQRYSGKDGERYIVGASGRELKVGEFFSD